MRLGAPLTSEKHNLNSAVEPKALSPNSAETLLRSVPHKDIQGTSIQPVPRSNAVAAGNAALFARSVPWSRTSRRDATLSVKSFISPSSRGLPETQLWFQCLWAKRPPTTSDRLPPNSDGLKTTSERLPPNNDGLQTTSERLPPNNDGLQTTSDRLPPNSDGLQNY